MNPMLCRGLSAIALILALIGNQASAQDLFRTVGVSTRDYNYVEAHYLYSSEVNNLFLLSGLISIKGPFALTGRYTNNRQSVENEELGSVQGRTDIYSFGLLYHNRLLQFDNIDWYAEVALGQYLASIDTNVIEIDEAIFLQTASAGLRLTVTERLELEASVDAFHLNEKAPFREVTNITVSGRAVFRIFNNFDLSLRLDEAPLNNILGLGLRYAW